MSGIPTESNLEEIMNQSIKDRREQTLLESKILAERRAKQAKDDEENRIALEKATAAELKLKEQKRRENLVAGLTQEEVSIVEDLISVLQQLQTNNGYDPQNQRKNLLKAQRRILTEKIMKMDKHLGTVNFTERKLYVSNNGSFLPSRKRTRKLRSA